MDMSVKKSEEIEDFSDLGSPIEFIYLGDRYFIPAVVPRKFNALVKMSKEISKKSEQVEKEIKRLQENNEEIPDALDNQLGQVFEFQIRFIIEAGLKKLDKETKVLSPVDFEECNDSWTNKLIGRVFKRINENMIDSPVDGEKKS